MEEDTTALLCETVNANLFENQFSVAHSTTEEVSLKDKLQQELSKPGFRKSNRACKPPLHLLEGVTDPSVIGQTIHKKFLTTSSEKTQKGSNHKFSKPGNKAKEVRRSAVYTDFKCDHCGTRYVVNPMRRGNKVSTRKYKAAPRHKIDPETQKILTLCNACGLKFKRRKKGKQVKEEISEGDLKKIQEQDQEFAKELSLKLENETAMRLYCSNTNKLPCRCIQKFICGIEESDVKVILGRADLLLTIAVKADELKKMKCYEKEPKQNGKVGLGNGHRKSQEFEDFVLSKRDYLRHELKLCEKGCQKILSYSNNFLHKRMKTDPTKGFRIERQKGKAALGMLKPIEDLPIEACCVDNCVRIALTHSRLLQTWRDRAISSQVEARRVLAEMLTPSGGNRANCYRFVSLVTGCSNTTIGKVNEQMKVTGGDREPPEHGLKKYWKENPKKKKDGEEDKKSDKDFVPSYEIIKTAANSAGIAKMLQDKTSDPPAKKRKRKQPKGTPKFQSSSKKDRDATLEITSAATGQVSSTVIAVYGNYENGFISLPPGINQNSPTISLQNNVAIETVQQQLQQQQQLQLQIQYLQQQLHNTQTNISQTTLQQSTAGGSEYVVAVSTPLDVANVQQNGTPVVVQTMQAVNSQPVVPDVVTQPIVESVVNSGVAVLPTLVTPAPTANVNFVTSSTDLNIISQGVATTNHSVQSANSISLLTSPLTNRDDISIIAQCNPTTVLTQPADGTTLLNRHPIAQILDNTRQVHVITSQSPTMAAVTQPVTLSLQNPSLGLSNLQTMLITHPTSTGEVVIQPATTPQVTEQIIVHQPLPTSINSSDHLLTVPTTSEPQSVSSTGTVITPLNTFNTGVFLSSSGSGTRYVFTNEGTSHLRPYSTESL